MFVMSGQRKPAPKVAPVVVKTAPVKESQKPVCANCKFGEVDTADRMYCSVTLPPFIRVSPYERGVMQNMHCDLHQFD